jgi:folate-binding protein YgfZ
MALIRPFSVGILDLRGEDRVRFLHGMVTNDIEKLAVGHGCHAAFLTTKGKLLGDCIVTKHPDRLSLDMDAELLEKIRAHLDKHIIMDDVELFAVTLPAHGVYGDDAAATVSRAIGVDVAALPPYAFATRDMAGAVRTTELGMPGFHVFGDVELGGDPLDDARFEELRIEAGTPRYGVDMGEDRLPIEAGINDAVSFDKGCYLGQEVIARATNLGHINRRLVGLVVDGEPPASGTKLSSPSKPDAGWVTSSARSRRLGKTIALGYVHRTLWDPGTTLTLADGRAATVSALPFA